MIDVELFLAYVTHQVKHTFHCNRATYLAMKGFLHFLQRRYSEALQTFEEAEIVLWQEHPTNHAREVLTTYGNYAWIYYYLTNYHKVKFYLDRIHGFCQSLDSPQPYSMIMAENQAQKGWSLLVGGFRTGELALRCFQEALREDRSNKEYLAGLAISLYYSYKHTGTEMYMEKAQGLLELVVLNQPQNYVLKVYLANLLVRKDERRTLRLLEEVIQNSFSADVLRKAAHLYSSELKWMSRAISVLERAVTLDPKYYFLHYELGSCYRYQMEVASPSDREALLESAMVCFQRAAEIDSLFVYPRLELAKIYGEKNPAYEEEVYLQLLEDLSHVNKTCQHLIHLCWGDFLLHKKGQKVEAQEAYMAGLNLFPEPGTRREQAKMRLRKLADMFEMVSEKERASAIYALLEAEEHPESNAQEASGP
ncbi:interferon-induced protein with tetratricopeptide repeats 5-like [Sceloporus undulatus]|uniref:interferon-induced protein with tetratricopeptide repeats 5-like n=1 Tax=Sceloporus undulatus TaxID=8520 RepID=UPI001C4B7914|nr:interferon-induced protein with tetratricopeptide repeats 5-like [Sceloporus undulatus]